MATFYELNRDFGFKYAFYCFLQHIGFKVIIPRDKHGKKHNYIPGDTKD